jgi:hypothetical protein
MRIPKMRIGVAMLAAVLAATLSGCDLMGGDTDDGYSAEDFTCGDSSIALGFLISRAKAGEGWCPSVKASMGELELMANGRWDIWNVTTDPNDRDSSLPVKFEVERNLVTVQLPPLGSITTTKSDRRLWLDETMGLTKNSPIFVAMFVYGDGVEAESIAAGSRTNPHFNADTSVLVTAVPAEGAKLADYIWPHSIHALKQGDKGYFQKRQFVVWEDGVISIDNTAVNATNPAWSTTRQGDWVIPGKMREDGKLHVCMAANEDLGEPSEGPYDGEAAAVVVDCAGSS